MRGHQIIEYEVPNPEEDTGSHRYVALVYYQKQGKQKFREFGLNIVPGNLPQECIRQKFQSRFFAADYDLDGPTGINFWETQWEEII
nr:PREDICTED: putative odorant-binding protein A5 [Bemisia tabaci]XP_018909538.1 PREDICTED: putative odorant-binding protein A5 [Bemisia tabaci]XP_018909539.1 PREDICTED: putative odorant-binding protein A5 [Bemisia tabaci]XP_018909540.1 PREDICTED: putative odorant-binding protein A5 [Bemisia tabaci]XP_018909541.1 PREDICTED: putative odorant-binding protein A5 [Bemisia tabaci]